MTNRICSLPDCGKPHVARGYCRTHYGSWHRTGDPVPGRTYVIGGRACSFPGCGKPHDCQGLCRGHNAQRDQGKRLTPLGSYWKSSDRDEQGRKRCRVCVEWLDVAQFSKRVTSSDGLDASCLRCCRDNKLRLLYGITLDAYLRRLEEQGGGCAICGGTNENGKELAVDHDHGCCPGRKSCGSCVRGLLCSGCNLGIGLFREDAAVLTAALGYLRR